MDEEHSALTKDDVLDVHRFLRDFDGDVGDLLDDLAGSGSRKTYTADGLQAEIARYADQVARELCRTCLTCMPGCEIARRGARCPEISSVAQQIILQLTWTPETGLVRKTGEE